MKTFYIYGVLLLCLYSCAKESIEDNTVQPKESRQQISLKSGLVLRDTPVKSAAGLSLKEPTEFYFSRKITWIDAKPWLELSAQDESAYWLNFEDLYPEYIHILDDSLLRYQYLNKALGKDLMQQLNKLKTNLIEEKHKEAFDDFLSLENSLESSVHLSNFSPSLLEYYIPYFLWSPMEGTSLDLKKDYGFFCAKLKGEQGSLAYDICALQFDYFPFDSTDYIYSSLYIVDASIIFSNLGDFGYINRLQQLDKLKEGYASDFLDYCWEETRENLLRRDIDYWQSREKIYEELDSMLYHDWKQKDLSLLLEIEALKRYFEGDGKESHLFDKRSG